MLISTRKVIIIVAVLLIATNLFAGWTQTYGGSQSDVGYSVDQASDGGYIIAGSTNSSGAGGYDVYLIKTNSNGNVVWSKTFGDISDNKAESVRQTSDGGYIIGGWENIGSNDDDWYLTKTNSSGHLVWEKFYDPGWEDKCFSVQQTTDGGYIFAGWQEIANQNLNAYLLKTNSNGDSINSQSYGGSENDAVFSVDQTSDGGYIAVGYTETAGDYDAWLIKFDNALYVVWDKEFDFGTTSDIAFSIQQTSDGGYIYAGYLYTNGFDGFLIKTNSSGDMVWGWSYGGSSYDEMHSVKQTSDGGYIMVGCTESYGAGGKDVWLIKTNSSGNVVWEKTFGGSSDDRGYSVQQTTDGGYIVAGWTESYGAGSRDVYLIKTNANGVAVEETVVSSPDNSSVSVFQGAENNLSISFTLAHDDNVKLNLYDLSGRLVSTPVSGFYIQGYHNVSHTMEKTGVYLYTFETSNFSESGKVIVF